MSTITRKRFADHSPSGRCLRVGILLGGRLVEERVVRAGQDVTVGTSKRCTFIVPSPAVPRRWSLFRWQGARCELHPHARMECKVASGDSLLSLARGQTTPLSRTARGKVCIDELTVLFQSVTLPSLPRPCLPASLRGSVVGMLDRTFAAILVICFVAHVAFVLQLRRVDWPKAPEHLADDFRQVFVRQPLLAPPEVARPSSPAREATEPKVRPHGEARPAKPTAQSAEARRDRLLRDVNKIGVLAVLTAKSAEVESAVADLLGNGGVERSQEDALAGVGGVGIASADLGLGIRLGTGNGKIMDVPGLANRGIGIAAADTGKRDERHVPRINTGQAQIDGDSPGHLDAGQLTREVKSRLGALRACYERSLKRNPSLTGKLLLHLTITPAGTVSSVDLTSDSLDDSELATCVRSSALRWRFPAPDGGSLEASFPFVFQSAS